MSQSDTMKAKQVRKRLINLVGTDEVSIRDRNSMIILQNRIEEEYKKKQRDKERDLENQERRRIRKLVLEGVIQEPEKDHRTRKPHCKSMAIEENDKWSILDGKYPYPPPPATTTPRHHQHNETNSNENENHNQRVDEDNVGDENSSGVGEGKEENKENSTKDGTENTEKQQRDENKTSQEDYGYMLRPYSARVENLIKEQSVSGMYEIAKDLVYVTEFSTQTKKKGNK